VLHINEFSPLIQGDDLTVQDRVMSGKRIGHAGRERAKSLECVAIPRNEPALAALDIRDRAEATKPFSFEILLARIRALGRRGPIAQPVLLERAGVSLHLGTREVRRGGRKIDLTRTEYAILELLMRNADHVLTRETIIERVWGADSNIENNTLDAFVRLLRAKVESAGEPRVIRTVRGVGYCLREGED
jgi:DNA-binding response OmpR family regulator